MYFSRKSKKGVSIRTISQEKSSFNLIGKKFIDITEWRVILVFYFILQLSTCLLFYFLVLNDPLNILIWKVESDIWSVDAKMFFLIIEKFPVYLLISFGVPIVLLIYTLTKGGVTENKQSVSFGFKKFLITELIAICTFLTTGLLGPWAHAEGGQWGWSLPQICASGLNVVREFIIPHTLNQLGFQIIFWGLMTFITLFSPIYRMAMAHSRKSHFYGLEILNASERAEKLAMNYIQTQLAAIKETLTEFPEHNLDLESIMRNIIIKDINQLKQSCERENITILSKKALLEYCFLVFDPVRENLRVNAIAFLELAQSSFMPDLTGRYVREKEGNAKYCSHCGAQNRLGSSFCSTCGEATI